MWCWLIGIHRQFIQRIQSGGSLAALTQHEAQADKSRANFSLCCAPTSGSSGAHGTVICRLEPWHTLCLVGSCVSHGIPEGASFASGWLLVVGLLLGHCEFPSIS